MLYYVMCCLMATHTSSLNEVVTTDNPLLQCGNDGHLYSFDIYPEKDNKTEFELQIASSNTFNTTNESYSISIYIQSHAKECVSPTYTLSYYQDNVTILSNNDAKRSECIHSSRTAPCPVMDTCIISDTSNITLNEFSRISLIFPPPQHKCNAFDSIDLKLTIQCLHADVTELIVGNYNISCSEDEPCRGNIACLEGMNCFIHCQHFRECDYDNLETCSACYDATFQCPDNGECAINCIGERSCYFATFHCPDNGDCAVNCIGERACYSAQFYGVNGHVHCDSDIGYSACGSAQFYGVRGDVHCDSDRACLLAQFYQVNGDIHCEGYASCALANITYSIAAKGNIVICEGEDACEGVVFDIYEWLWMTNGDQTEHIVVTVGDGTGLVGSISNYGDVFELLEESSETELYSHLCGEWWGCTINVISLG
eukprot:438420_1